MTMVRGGTEIDRLIEQGLGLYGEGDLDGALLLWERALAIDPDNAQANSYVDYVRMNYELLTSDAGTEHSGPFGIGDDDPDYQIEIMPGDDVGSGGAAAPPKVQDARDEGWWIGDEPDLHSRPTREAVDAGTMVLEADEPPGLGVIDDPHAAAAKAAAARRASEPVSFEGPGTGESISFEDSTREYPGGAGRPASALLGEGLPAPDIGEFAPDVTPPFGSARDFQTPQDFGSQLTDVRRRDLGFVQPAPGTRDPRDPRDPRDTRNTRDTVDMRDEPPELKMTLRTPTPTSAPALAAAAAAAVAAVPEAPDPHRAPTADGDADGDDAVTAVATGNSKTLDLGDPIFDGDTSSAYDSLDLELSSSSPEISLDLGRVETRPSGFSDDALPRPTTTGDLDDDDDALGDAFDDDLDGLGGDVDDDLSHAGSGERKPDPPDPDDLLKTLPVPSNPRVSTGGLTRQLAPRAATSETHLDDRPTREMSPELKPPPIAVGSAQTQEMPYTIQLDPRLAIPADPQRPQTSPAMTRDFSEPTAPPTASAASPATRPSTPPVLASPTGSGALPALSATLPAAPPGRPSSRPPLVHTIPAIVPAASSSTTLPAASSSGALPAASSSGALPAAGSSGALPAAGSSGALPAAASSGALPAVPARPSAPTASQTFPSFPAPGAPPPRADDPMIFAPTRELGLRTERRPPTEDEPTAELDVHKIRAHAANARTNGRPLLPGMDPIDARSAEILEEVDRAAPTSETREDRTRRRITALLERATEWGRGADLERSVTAVDLALSEDPNSALAQKLIHRNRDTIMNAFQNFLGDLQRTPVLARPLHELGSAPISPRAAFLLSRVDGTLSLDEILDVSGMPRLEAYRYLCQLFLRGILR